MAGVVQWIVEGVGIVMYYLLGWALFWVIDVLDNIFRSLAGMGGDYRLNGAAGDNSFYTDGGLIYDLLRTDIVKKLIIAIMILAAFLLIIFTVMAFLKNVYAQKQKTAKDILANSLKGIIYFIFVPVCTLLGVYLGNIVLKAVDGATSLGGSSRMSGKLFIACAYDANKFRTGGLTTSPEDVEKLKTVATHFGYKNVDQITANLTSAEYADLLDDVFATSPNADFSAAWVDGYYSVININYLVLIVGGVFIIYVLCSLAFAMARRIYIMLIWFVISPACCAMFPIDEGKMVGKYKDEMTKQVLSAYGAVAGVNLFFSVLPLIDNIKLGTSGWDDGMSGFVNMFMIICGLLCVKELVSSLSSLVGGEDALAKGSSLMKSTTGAMKKYGGGLAKKTAGAIGKFRADTKDKTGTEFWKAAGQSLWKHQGLGALSMATQALTGVNIEETKKAFKDAEKAEKEENRTQDLKDMKKRFFSGTAFNQAISDYNAATTDEERGAAINAAIKKGTAYGATADEVIEKLVNNPNVGADEVAIRSQLASYEKEKSKKESASATYMPALNNAEAEYDAAIQKHSRATARQTSAESAAAVLATKAITGGSARDRAVFSAVQSFITSGDYNSAEQELKKINVDKMGTGQFRADVLALGDALKERSSAVSDVTAANDAISNITTNLATIVENMNNMFDTALPNLTTAATNIRSNINVKNELTNVRNNLK